MRRPPSVAPSPRPRFGNGHTFVVGRNFVVIIITRILIVITILTSMITSVMIIIVILIIMSLNQRK